MSDVIRDNASRFRERWGQMPGQRRNIWLLSAVVSIVAAAGVLTWAVQPRYSPLYSQLQEEDAGAIVERLKADKIPYRIGQDGATIEVPSSQMRELKMKMATAGLPQSGGPGWELFDKSPFGMTDFTQKLNLQRALQGELAKTIMQLNQVESCRVHLTMPERSLYEEDKQDATASVVLSLRGSRGLSKSEVKGIIHLVSHAVVGLKPENVTLIDSRGSILSTDDLVSDDSTSPEQAETQLQMQGRVERKVQNEIQTMMDRMLGPEQAVVRVRAKMDFSRKETNTETYTAADGSPISKDAKGVLTEQHTVEETYAGRNGAAAGSVPGMVANVAGVIPGLQGYRSEGGAPGGGYLHRETTARYNVSKKVERLVTNPGDMTRLSVAVVVNGALDEEKRAAITQVASAAAGLDTTRGDQISVVGVAFDTKAAQEEQRQMAAAERRQMISTGMRYGIAMLAMLFIFLAARQALRKPVPLPVPATLPVPADAAGLDGAPTVGQLLDEMEATPLDPSDAEAAAALQAHRPLEPLPTLTPSEERLRRLAADDPEFVARLLRGWLVGPPRR